MKTVTCKMLGGPCDFAMHGNSADDIIKAGEQHLNDMVAKNDEAHQPAAQMMAEMRKNPTSGMEWYMKTKADFAALPDDK